MSSSPTYSEYYPWKAFDKNGITNNVTGWATTTTGALEYLIYYSPIKVRLTSVIWKSSNYAGHTINVKGSNDNSTWTTLGDPIANSSTETWKSHTMTCNVMDYFQYFKIEDTPRSGVRAQCCEIQLIGYSLNTSPTYWHSWASQQEQQLCIKY